VSGGENAVLFCHTGSDKTAQRHEFTRLLTNKALWFFYYSCTFAFVRGGKFISFVFQLIGISGQPALRGRLACEFALSVDNDWYIIL
jgi:hypothetical protein